MSPLWGCVVLIAGIFVSTICMALRNVVVPRMRMAWIALRILAKRAGVHTIKEVKKDEGSDEHVRVDMGTHCGE